MSYPFFKMAACSHIGYDLGNVRHPRSAIAGLSLILKFGFDPIYSFEDIAIFKFLRFGLKFSIHARYGEFWGHIFPKYGHPSF